jgi:hypothetical protein
MRWVRKNNLNLFLLGQVIFTAESDCSFVLQELALH